MRDVAFVVYPGYSVMALAVVTAFEVANIVADDPPYELHFVSETGGKPKAGFAEKRYKDKAVWLRMEISGGKARGLFRATDKNDWQALGQCDLPPAKGEVRIGLLTGYAAKGAMNVSRFRNFRVLAEAK